MTTPRVVLVTGAGRGIGRAHALAMAADGHRVVVNDRGTGADGRGDSRSPADEVVAEILAVGGEGVASHGDVCDEGDAAAMVGLALDTWGRLDAVVNNAGILRSGLLLRTGPEEWRAVLEVHVIGTMLVTRAAAAFWRDEAKAGRTVDASVVNTSSTAGLFGFVGEPAYSAAKAGVIGFTLTAAAELGRYGVRVNAVAPAAATRLTAWAGDNPSMAPELVSPVVVWLAGPRSVGVTGRVLEAGGGTISAISGWQRAETIVQENDSVVVIGERVRDALARLPPPVPPWTPS